jgi:DNA-directed RNA polymerase
MKLRKNIEKLKQTILAFPTNEERQDFLDNYVQNNYQEKLDKAYENGLLKLAITNVLHDNIYNKTLSQNLNEVDLTNLKNMDFIVGIFHNFRVHYSNWLAIPRSKEYAKINLANYALEDVRKVYWIIWELLWTLSLRDKKHGPSLQNISIKLGRSLMKFNFVNEWKGKTNDSSFFENKELQKLNLVVGQELIFLLQRASGNFIEIVTKTGFKEAISLVLFNPVLFLEKFDDVSLFLIKPSLLPRIIEPIKWTLKNCDGISIDEVNFYTFVRENPNLQLTFPSDDEKQRVLDIINKLQATKLSISKDVVDFMWECHDSLEHSFNFIVSKKMVQDAYLQKEVFVNKLRESPYKEWDKLHKETPEKLKAVEKSQLFALRQQKVKAEGIVLALKQQFNQQMSDLCLLDLFSIFPQIFFQWNVDSRLRHYVCNIINHQKEQYQRACFFLAKKVDLSGEGLQNFSHYLADLYGDVEKVVDRDIKDQWVNLHKEKLKNPLAHKEWLYKAKKAGLFVAAALEFSYILKALEKNEKPCTNLLMWIDASVNALQHENGFVRDADIAILLNMTSTIPTQVDSQVIKLSDSEQLVVKLRTDLYEFFVPLIKQKLCEKIKKLEEQKTPQDKKELANRLRFFLNKGFIKRSFIKKPIMSFAYGVTKDGVRDQLAEELNTPNQFFETGLLLQDYSFLATSVIIPIMHKKLRTFLHYMFVLQLAVQNGINCKTSEQIPSAFWYVPILNCKIFSQYKPLLTGVLDVNILGKRKQTTFKYVRNTWDKKIRHSEKKKGNVESCLSNTARSISPNFIHSLDATTMLLFIEMAQFPVLSIHDSIGAHPNNITLSKLLFKESFLKVHHKDPFKSFFVNQNLEKVPLIEGLSLKSPLYLALKNYIKVDFDKEGKQKYYLDINEFISKTRGTFNLDSVKEALYFIS